MSAVVNISKHVPNQTFIVVATLIAEVFPDGICFEELECEEEL